MTATRFYFEDHLLEGEDYLTSCLFSKYRWTAIQGPNQGHLTGLPLSSFV
jgi:hypothetical protein